MGILLLFPGMLHCRWVVTLKQSKGNDRYMQPVERGHTGSLIQSPLRSLEMSFFSFSGLLIRPQKTNKTLNPSVAFLSVSQCFSPTKNS